MSERLYERFLHRLETFETSSSSSSDSEEGNPFENFLAKREESEEELELPPYANPFAILEESSKGVPGKLPPQRGKPPKTRATTSFPPHLEQKASVQATKVLNYAKQTKDTKKKKPVTYHSKRQQKETPTRNVPKRQEKRGESALAPIVVDDGSEDADEALARELQNAWNLEAQRENTEMSDEMLAHMLQQAEESERRKREARELLRRQRSLLMREMSRHLTRGSRFDQNAVDVDNMSYEELLALEERIGNVKSHGASKEEVHSLPVTIVEENLPEEMTRCSICLSDFEKGDTLKTLPCFHKYHSDCVDHWLFKKKTCPVCQRPIVEDS